MRGAGSRQRLHNASAPPLVTFAAITFTNAGRVLSRAPLASRTHFIIVIPYYEERVSQWQVFILVFEAKQQDK